MFNVFAQTPYCGVKHLKVPKLTTIRYDTITKDGVDQMVKVVEPLELPDYGNLKSQDFSMKTIREAGLEGNLKPSALLKLSPLDAQECVITATDALNDADFAEKLRATANKQNVESPAAETADSNQN